MLVEPNLIVRIDAWRYAHRNKRGGIPSIAAAIRKMCERELERWENNPQVEAEENPQTNQQVD